MRRCPAALALLCLAVACLASPANAQAPDKRYRLGILSPSIFSLDVGIRGVMLPALAQQGFVEGRNLVVDARVGTAAEFPALARELVAAGSDAIIAIAPAAVRAARAASSDVPIVMVASADPVASGWAASLARPGGNVTGVVILGPELNAKRTQLLLDAVPTVRRIAVLATDPALDAVQVAAIRKVVADAGLEFLAFYAAPPDYRAAFAAMSAARADALVVTSAPEYLRDWAAALHSFALAAGLPTACQWREMAEQGCLLGYGPSYAEIYRRTADLVARVFRGARPAELPIEGPTHFEFMINLRTANALGITIPPNLLARADEVIE